VYHRTSAAQAILSGGFKDATGTYMTRNEYTGVWLSDEPLDINEGADGDTILTLDIPETILVEWEWVEEGKGFREFLVPAKIVNTFGPPELAEQGLMT